MNVRTGSNGGRGLRRAFIAGLLIACAVTLIPSSACFPTSLTDEASRLRTANIKNLEVVTSLSLSCRVTVTKLDGAGKAIAAGSAAIPAAEQSLWDRKGKKLKRKQGRGDIVATVADGQAATLAVQTTSTVTVEPLAAEETESATTPSPFWFWQPGKYNPEKPAAVREDGTALVLSTSIGNPKREIWLDRATGRLLKFEDTSAKGRKYRTVVCVDWKQVSGVWVPSRIEERVQARLNGVKRIVELSDAVINPTVSGADFVLP
jgi:hypothetical protein